jgi:hypothetical protein
MKVELGKTWNEPVMLNGGIVPKFARRDRG